MNPLVHRPIRVAASAISCLGLVYSAHSQSRLGQTRVAHDAAGLRNGMLPPLVDLGPGQTYNGQEGGLYPGGSNVRPAAHDAAGQKIARDIVPLAADGEQSKLAWKEIVRAIYIRYPNVRIIYSSTKGTMYMSASATENPEFVGGPIEPFNHDAAWGVKWVIADQIKGAADLNYDPARGPVKAPWLSWGP